MAEKPAVAVRLTKPTIARVGAYAESHEVSRQVVYESAILRFLDEAEQGLATVVRPAASSRVELSEAQRREREAAAEMQAAHLARQAKLNAEKARASAARR